jgi:DNA invertase Pin-like site-specific DNA recombinase
MANIGYIRVSTEEQNTDRQLDGIELDKIFTDKKTGSNRDRQGLKDLMLYAREGDVVFIHELSRLSRNIVDVNNIVRELVDKKVAVRFIKENLTFNGNASAVDNYFLNMLASFAQYQREVQKEAQAEGIRKAKERGVYKGGKKIYSDKICETVRQYKRMGYQAREIMAITKLSIDTIKYILYHRK